MNLISGFWKYHQTKLILDISSLARCWLHLIMGVDYGVKGLQNQLCFLFVQMAAGVDHTSQNDVWEIRDFPVSGQGWSWTWG